MILREFYKTSEGVKLCKTYSDSGYYIKKIKDGALYKEAIDVVPVSYRYVETDILIPTKKEKTTTEEITKEE